MLDTIAKTKGNKKIEAIREADHLKTAFHYAYNPFLRWGISSARGIVTGESDSLFLLDSAIQHLPKDKDKAIEIAIRLNPELQEVFHRVVEKDLRIGAGATTINKAFPNLVPVFTPMGAIDYEERHVLDDMIVQPKPDGIRTLCIIKNGDVDILSRAGHPIISLEWMKPLVLETAGWIVEGVLDCEVTVGNFDTTVKKIRAHAPAKDAILYPFDVVVGDIEGIFAGKHDEPQYERLRRLYMMHSHCIFPLPYKRLPKGEIDNYYQEMLNLGYEGCVVKNPYGLWRPRKHKDWLKMKEQDTHDAPIIDMEEGTGKNKGRLGALVVDINGKHVRVGGGMTEKEREEMWENKGVYIGKTAEIEAQGVTTKGSLRHPRLVRIRDDKPLM